MVQRLIKNSTQKVAEAMQKALMEHANQGKSQVSVEGVFVAILEQKDSIIFKVMDELDIDKERIRDRIYDISVVAMNKLPSFSDEKIAHLSISQDLENLFRQADVERKLLKDSFISTQALFLAGFSESVPGSFKMFADLGITYEDVLSSIKSIRGGARVLEKDGESRESYLDEYTVDLTALARKSELDPVIGRDREVERVVEILSRRKKNNPLLLGDPGVGKTVIVEALANRISSADVPEHLLTKRLLSLDVSSVVSGAKMQGEFEERLKNIKDEVIASHGEIVLFIDEIHTMVGAGRSQGALDASNMLKPALSSGKLQCIGATTSKEYKKYFESDKALDRRFQQIKVSPPSVEHTVEILDGLKEKYQEHHGVEYTSKAIEAAAELTDRYISDRNLPDKAIDVIDEAGAIRRLKLQFVPPELRDLEREKQKLMEKKSKAFNEQDFERMALFQMDLAKLESEMEKARGLIDNDIVDRFIDQNDIASVVSRISGIPVSKMADKEVEKYLNIETSLSARVVGQIHAVKSVSEALKRSRSGLKRANAPIASFLFLGPTGVGKTELAKAVAHEVMGRSGDIIRVDMSEYMERHEVAKLIGSPPGYVGYGEGGILTEAVRRHPYSVVLFDEFEKAHPDIFNLLLPIFDEGRLSDGEGNVINFRNCILIGTSNLGAEVLTDRKRPIGIGAKDSEWSRDEEYAEIMKIVKGTFRPEFINRLDEIIVFNRLSTKDMKKIIELLMSNLSSRLAFLGLTLNVDPSISEFIIKEVDSHNFGARPLQRKVEKLIENKIASGIISKSGNFSIVEVVLSKGNEIEVLVR